MTRRIERVEGNEVKIGGREYYLCPEKTGDVKKDDIDKIYFLDSEHEYRRRKEKGKYK